MKDEYTAARKQYKDKLGNGFWHWRRWVQVELRMHRSEGNQTKRIANLELYQNNKNR